MSKFERRAWMVATIILIIWGIVFCYWMFRGTYPAILYP